MVINSKEISIRKYILLNHPTDHKMALVFDKAGRGRQADFGKIFCGEKKRRGNEWVLRQLF